jgi:hypothetical protein
VRGAENPKCQDGGPCNVKKSEIVNEAHGITNKNSKCGTTALCNRKQTKNTDDPLGAMKKNQKTTDNHSVQRQEIRKRRTTAPCNGKKSENAPDNRPERRHGSGSRLEIRS